jgi:hypothetical protein
MADQQLPKAPNQFDRELDFPWIIKFLSVIGVVTIVMFVGMWLLTGYLDNRLAEVEATRDTSPLLAPGQTTVPPKPHLQSEPYGDWARMKAAQDRELSTYGWVDRESGRVRVPVDEAMAEIAEHGLPSFEATGDGTLVETSN